MMIDRKERRGWRRRWRRGWRRRVLLKKVFNYDDF